MVVVQMDHDRGEAEGLLAVIAAGALPHRSLEAIEEPFEILRGAEAARLRGQAIHPFVGRAERAGRAAAAIVVAKRLVRPP